MQEKNTKQPIVDTIEKNFMPYAMSVIVSRALPEIDGFKPSHRKLLYTMYKMGLLTGHRTKSANVVGQTMKLNPHNDQAIYETMVRLTKGNEALLHPFVDSKGNFGKQYSSNMKYAASRYTEVKLEKICEEVFKDLDKDSVDFVDNYDSTMKEPALLPTTFPNILVNPNLGIAVGMTSNICSFNLKEVINAIIAYMDNENADMSAYIKAPDFSTGGTLIYNKKDMEDILRTGRGSFKVRAKYRFDKKNSMIEVFEIPYTTTVEAIIDSIEDIVKSGKIKDITNARDETDLGGLKIAIEIKRSADPEIIMQKLFKLTPLEDSFGCNFNVLINGYPKILGVRDIIREWIIFRQECVKRQLKFDIGKMSEKLHLLEGLSLILLDIDKAISIIRHTEEDSLVIQNLMNGFGIDRVQAEYVAEIKLRNLNKKYILDRVGEINNLQNEISNFNEILQSEKKVRKLIAKQLHDIAKRYGADRKTDILMGEHVEEITSDKMIEDYNLKIFFTEQNYLKKIPLTSLRQSPDHKLKEDDKILVEFDARNKMDIILFSDRQLAYKLKLYEVPDSKASSLGEYLPNLLSLAPGEKIVFVLATEDYKGNLLFGFENGKVAKVELSGYATKTNRKKLQNAYSDLSPLVNMYYLVEDQDFLAISDIGKALVFNTSLVNSKAARDTQGVQALKSKKGSVLIKLIPLDSYNLSDPDYYRTQNIPAVGCYLKDEDKLDKQMTLI